MPSNWQCKDDKYINAKLQKEAQLLLRQPILPCSFTELKVIAFYLSYMVALSHQ